MDRSRPRGEADLGESCSVRLQRPLVFSTRLTIKGKWTERRTRGPTFSCQSPSVTGLHVSHDPLQRVWSYYECVCQVNVFMQLLQSIFCLLLASLFKIRERKHSSMHLKKMDAVGNGRFLFLKKQDLSAQDNGISPGFMRTKRANVAVFVVGRWKWILRNVEVEVRVLFH